MIDPNWQYFVDKIPTILVGFAVGYMQWRSMRGQRVISDNQILNNRKARFRSNKTIKAIEYQNGNFDAANARIASLDKQLAEQLLIMASMREEIAELKSKQPHIDTIEKQV
jgi:hypothetical protein